jgi:hemolysin activation/secretion protein
MVLQLELHRPLSIGSVSGFDAFFFVDGGFIRQHQNTWTGWDTRRSGNNDYSLAATGLGLAWQGKGGLTLNAILARPLGNNPGSGINDHNQDGTRVATRFWLTLNQPF